MGNLKTKPNELTIALVQIVLFRSNSTFSFSVVDLEYLAGLEVRKTDDQVDKGFLDTEGNDFELSSLSLSNPDQNYSTDEKTFKNFSLDEKLFIEINKTFKNITNDFLSDRLSLNIAR